MLSLLFAAAMSLGPGIALGQATDPERPNIVLIIGDDHGWPYFGFMGSDIIQTPNLDTLAAEGTVFTHGFSTASICTPALRTLLSGLHPATWIAHRADTEAALGRALPYPVVHFQTLPRQLSRRGYRSFEGGKLWEGSAGMVGFDAGTQESIDACPHMSAWCHGEALGWNVFGRVHMNELWDFLLQDDDRPFFVWFAPMLPHYPMDPPKEYVCIYLPKPWQRLLGCDPDLETIRPTLHGNAIQYYANITRFDDVVAELTRFLDDHGMRENTLLIYLSDNGYQQDPYTKHRAGPWVGGPKGKVTIYELGFRTPVIFNWPGHVPAGLVLDDLVSFEDVYSTVLGYAGVTAPADRQGGDLRPRMDGTADPFRDRLIGNVTVHQLPEEEIPPPFEGLAQRKEEAFFLRTKDCRYVQFPERGYEALYPIRIDPFENTDISARYPGLVTSFREQVSVWKTYLAGYQDMMEVAGRLSTLDGTPIPLARVSLVGSEEGGQRVFLVVHTAGDGSFVFPDIAAGEYTLTVHRAGKVTYDDRVVDVIPLDLRQRSTGPYLPLQGELLNDHGPVETTSEILGQVTTADGAPVGGLALEIHHYGLFWRGRTNAEGRFEATALPSGRYRIHFGQRNGYRRIRDATVRLRTKETRHVNVTAHCRPRERSWPGWWCRLFTGSEDLCTFDEWPVREACSTDASGSSSR